MDILLYVFDIIIVSKFKSSLKLKHQSLSLFALNSSRTNFARKCLGKNSLTSIQAACHATTLDIILIKLRREMWAEWKIFLLVLHVNVQTLCYKLFIYVILFQRKLLSLTVMVSNYIIF